MVTQGSIIRSPNFAVSFFNLPKNPVLHNNHVDLWHFEFHFMHLNMTVVSENILAITLRMLRAKGKGEK